MGRVGRSHGLDGAMRLLPENDAAIRALESALVVWIDGLGEARVLEFAPHGRHWLLRVDRIRRVESAKAHLHAAVRVDPATLPSEIAAAMAPDATGLPVWVDGERYGTVAAVEPGGANPLLIVRGPTGERPVPLRAPYVEVGPDAVRLHDPPPGLLEDEP